MRVPFSVTLPAPTAITLPVCGIFLPDTAAKEKPQTGKVIAVGAGKVTENGTRIVPEVKVGEEVVFAKYSGSEFTHEGKKYLILAEHDVLAVIEK